MGRRWHRAAPPPRRPWHRAAERPSAPGRRAAVGTGPPSVIQAVLLPLMALAILLPSGEHH